MPVVDLRSFGSYMATIVSAASNVTLYAEPMRKPEKPKGKEKGFVNTHTTDSKAKSIREGKEVIRVNAS